MMWVLIVFVLDAPVSGEAVEGASKQYVQGGFTSREDCEKAGEEYRKYNTQAGRDMEVKCEQTPPEEKR